MQLQFTTMQRRSWLTAFHRLSSTRAVVRRLGSSSVTSRCCYEISRRCLSSEASAQKLRFGQPVFETHPHLLKSGEVTPGCTALEYAMRRAKLASDLPDGALAICASSYVKYRSGPVFYEFHQDPDFYYLTGFLEPEAVCVIEKTGSDGDHMFHMFVREKDDRAELWDGARSGVQAAIDVFNADEAGNIDHLRTHLTPLIEKAKTIYADVGLTAKRPTSVFSSIFSSGAPDSMDLASMLTDRQVIPLKPLMHKMRVFKSEPEVINMRKAGKISGRAFNMAMQNKFRREKDLWAFLEYRFRTGGCENSAYVPVVAGGQNACTIHYTRNDDILRDGEMVLVDAGGQYGGYVTDITRTWPISGRFTPAQRDLYQAVLNVQKQCVALCRENAKLSLDEIHTVAEVGLKEELKNLGFDISKDALGILFPHHLGHFVGIDIHDSGSYPRSLKLKTSQCVTIEPGIYVPDDERWPEHFRGMGIRIEDSVCVGEEGPIILSVEAAKEIVDIETLGESHAQ